MPCCLPLPNRVRQGVRVKRLDCIAFWNCVLIYFFPPLFFSLKYAFCVYSLARRFVSVKMYRNLKSYMVLREGSILTGR